MVVELSAATLQGAPVVTHNVDFWFEKLGDSKFSRALQSVGAACVPPGILNPPMLAGAGADHTVTSEVQSLKCEVRMSSPGQLH